MPPLTDLFAAVRWWAALLLLGTAVTPLVWTLFQRLPDRGYAFTKMAGLLLVSYLFWMLGSLGFLPNNLGGVLVALLLAGGLSLVLYRRQAAPGALTAWLRANRGQVLLTELLFLVVFATWVWVRAQNPAIQATEKPMEFAFLNAVGRSPAFPPLDPWLSGFAISYYYFGYVMTSLLARLAAVPEAVAFNLGIAWLVAGTAVGAFGLVYNLVAGIRGSQDQEEAADTPARGLRQLAVGLGLVAALALPIAGNQQITLEVLHAGNVGSAEFWQWLDVRDLNTPPTESGTPRYESSGWWWWRASRVIHEYHLSGRAEEGLEPIVEFPGFSFLLGDMHPHVLALPFAFLSLAVAYLWYLSAADVQLSIAGLRLIGEPSSIDSRPASIPLWAFTALLLGGLSFLNTWDVLIHLFVVLGAYLLGRWQREGWHAGLLPAVLRLALALALPAVLLYLPFYLGFRSQAGAPYLLPMLMRPTRLPHFLIIFAMPLSSIGLLLGSLALRHRFRGWRMGLAAALGLLAGLLLLMLLLSLIVAGSAGGAGRVAGLASELDIRLPPRPETAVSFGWGLRALGALLPAVLAARLAYPALTLCLLAIVALVVIGWQGDGRPGQNAAAAAAPLPFVLLLIFTGTLLTLGPEFVYLRDNFGVRLNTTFKFYYQAWVLFGIAALFGIGYLWRTARAPAYAAAAGYGFLFCLALLFPFYGVQSRAAEYRGPVTAESRQPATLDGLAYLRIFQPAEYDAIAWLRQNVRGTPVIVEAVGGQYSEYGRIAASTGLPTILGWAGHEYQWRGSDTPEPAQRDPAVQQIYTETSWTATASLLDRYQVSYIIVGSREAIAYGSRAVEKFSGRLEVAYQNDGYAIYRWQPGAASE